MSECNALTNDLLEVGMTLFEFRSHNYFQHFHIVWYNCKFFSWLKLQNCYRRLSCRPITTVIHTTHTHTKADRWFLSFPKKQKTFTRTYLQTAVYSLQVYVPCGSLRTQNMLLTSLRSRKFSSFIFKFQDAMVKTEYIWGNGKFNSNSK